MDLPPLQQLPTPPATSYVVAREDVQWGRPIFRAPALTVFTAPELLRPRAPVFPARRFRALARKKPSHA
jgi:hypothetical protein